MPSLRLLLLSLAAVVVGLAAAAASILLVGDRNGEARRARTSTAKQPVAGAPVRLAGTNVSSGKTVRLADFAGKPAVVTVWASWCAPCRRQASALRRFAASRSGVGFLAVDTQESEGAARAFLNETGLEIATIADPDGRLAAKLGVRELPTTLFLASDRGVAVSWEGPAGLGELASALRTAKQAG
jgi:thiol-disulfide isomerase/thioredoxin